MSFKVIAPWLIVLVGSCAFVVGCEKQRSIEVSAGITAEASSDGPTVVRKPTRQEVAGLNEVIAKREAVNARYPGSQTPWGASSERVIEILVPGILELQDGRRVRLDGVRCGEKAVGYLRRALQDETTKVAFLPSVESHTDPIPAEVWSVDTDLQAKNLATGPSYSNVTETAITSGWCEVEATATCKHNERYAALAKAFSTAAAAR